MTEISSTWLVGSFVLTPAATLTVNGNAHIIAADTYYLRDATAGLSLIAQLEAAIAAEVPGSTVVICKDRKLRITSGAGALTLAVPAALQAVTGLAASPTVGTTVAATSISTLLWAPGWPETSNGHPVHSDGFDVHDRVLTASATGLNANVTTHHSTRLAAWSWFFVPVARAWTASKLPGEFVRFRADVLLPGYRFKLYSQMDEDEASTAAVSWVTAYGPYIARTLPPDWYRRSVATSDALGSGVELDAMITSEIT